MQKGKSLSEVSSFGIGGPADYFTTVQSVQDLQDAFLFSLEKDLNVFILGKGSNCLFDDAGFRGLVIHNKIDDICYEGTQIDVGSGYSFSLLGSQTARKGLSGLEFASGIPGTVGGAVFMNAGANGKETSSSLISVTFVTRDGVIKEFKKEELEFKYRYSSFHKMKGAIARATFSLEAKPDAREDQLSILERRMKTQPLKEKSAGCIFRNPTEKSAGFLIEQCGLKGRQIGGARVSKTHANFIINVGGASSQDVLDLVAEINKIILQKTGIHLDMEVRVISETHS